MEPRISGQSGLRLQALLARYGAGATLPSDGLPDLVHLRQELVRGQKTGDSRIAQKLPLRGDEGDGRQRLHVESVVERLDHVVLVRGVDLDVDEAQRLRDDAGLNVRVSLQLFAGRTPFSAEINHHRPTFLPRLPQSDVELRDGGALAPR